MAAPKGNQYAKGNPGPWKDKPLTDLLRRALLQGDAKKARRVAENLVALAGKRDTRAVAAIKEVFDRIEGKVAQPLTGEGGTGPVVVEVVRFGAKSTNPG